MARDITAFLQLSVEAWLASNDEPVDGVIDPDLILLKAEVDQRLAQNHLEE